jgi:hypothetical protein
VVGQLSNRMFDILFIYPTEQLTIL